LQQELRHTSPHERAAAGRRDSRRRAALAFTLVSWVLWTAWGALSEQRDPVGDLSGGVYTDHFSHMNVARLFPRIGGEIWRTPIEALLPAVSPEALARLPADVQAAALGKGEAYAVPGWPEHKPALVNWSHRPRFYPPGDLLLVAPVATAYHWTDLSFSGATRLLRLLFLLYAHVALFCFFRSVLAWDTEPTGLDWAAMLLVYAEVVHWTLEGFYDAAAIAPLALCADQLRRRDGLRALLAFSAAVFLHFRALFFLPWAVIAAREIVRRRQWRAWRGREIALAGTTAALALAAFYPFALLLPVLTAVKANNPILLSQSALPLTDLLLFAAATAVAAGVAVWARSWWNLATLLWLAFLLLQLREAHLWHPVLALLPWLCLAAGPTRRARDPAFRTARLAFVCFATHQVFGSALALDWLAAIG
jgi:hypothetical protein